MNRVRSGDAEIVYTVLGDGPPLALLHPFPAHHALWLPAAQSLTSRYRVILPDVRGHGESEIGDGPATIEKHATDLARVLDDAGVGRAIFFGVSIGGYILFEFWRRYRGRVAALGLCCTRLLDRRYAPAQQRKTLSGGPDFARHREATAPPNHSHAINVKSSRAWSAVRF